MVRDTFYSYISTERLSQRVGDTHGKNKSLYSLVLDHLCGRLPGQLADRSLSVSLAALSMIGDNGNSNVCGLHLFLFLFSNFVCGAAAFSQRGKCLCYSACSMRELVVRWYRWSLLCSFNLLSIPLVVFQ